ncbi:MAG: hypothetical protein ACSHYF_04020 [Verrucomicrobiaceae bacterium]
MRFLGFLSLLALPAFSQEKIDLVQLGRETFHAVGCAECHSEIKNDDAVKTGPGLYGLFQQKARKREVLSGGEQHRQTVTADFNYFRQSLRRAAEDIAIAESGATKGEPYLPIMPPYDGAFISDFKAKAIYQYLLTLNDAGKAGPKEVLVDAKKNESEVLTPIADPAEILVTDRTRIYRARVPKSSTRAVFVGTPGGLNYAFDPISLSIERVWWGGFLNIREEVTGRGGKPARLGQNAMEVDLYGPLLAPLHPKTGAPIDLSFKSPKTWDNETIGKNLYGKEDFADQLAAAGGNFLGYRHADVPTFSFEVGKNVFHLQFTLGTNGQGKISLTGELVSPQKFQLSPVLGREEKTWTVDKLPAEITFQLPKPVGDPWRPDGVTTDRGLQKIVSSKADKVWLPQGYGAEAIAPPLDVNGRVQLFEPLGMDISPNGAIIVSTRTAGLWKLEAGSWVQIGEGLLDALGVIVEDEHTVIVAQKPELTRLRDTDGDGWMDHYETLNDDFLISVNYHEYLHGPAKGEDGNYYVQTNLAAANDPKHIYKADGAWMGAQGGLRGWSLQISPEGEMTPFSWGLRSPAGLGTGPDGKLYYSENQGEYVGTSKLFILEQDKFYGHPSGLVDLPGLNPDSPELKWDAVKDSKVKAIALMPHSRLANSPGSPVWDRTEGKFGPFTGQMFMGDQTLSNIFRILPKPHHEAALIPFAHGFPSGVMRLEFDPKGDLFVGQTGRGWRAQGGKEDALVRIYRTKTKPANQLHDVTREGASFTLHFTQALEKAPAVDKISLSSWTYLDSPKYGSPENDKTGHKIVSMKRSADGTSLTLHLESLPPSGENQVFQFHSKSLPPTKGDLCEAFYSIVRK